MVEFEACSGAFSCVIQDTLELLHLEPLEWANILYLVLFYLVSFGLTWAFRTSEHMKRLKESALWSLIFTLAAGGLFVVVMIFISPIKQYDRLKSQYQIELAGKAKLQTQLADKDLELKEVKRLKDLAESKASGMDAEKTALNAAIENTCFNKPLKFKEARSRASPPKDMEALLYAKQIELWPRLGPSETGRIRVWGNVPFSGPAEPRDVIKTLATNGISADYDVYPTISQRTSVTFTIYSVAPFNVLCIDKLPLPSD